MYIYGVSFIVVPSLPLIWEMPAQLKLQASWRSLNDFIHLTFSGLPWMGTRPLYRESDEN